MTPFYSPNTNSVVERANGIIASTFKKVINKHPEKLALILPNALLAINTRKQNSSQKFPFYLPHGYKPRLPHELHIRSVINGMSREDQRDLLSLDNAEAPNTMYKMHLTNRRSFDLLRRTHLFKSEDLELCKSLKQGYHKLSAILKEPFVNVRTVAVLYATRSSL
ncbi:uncharacterized protein NPIL_467851 [Nephila pilipes]|uniref:Integrase catalytic domain-containing protein n=1 Tax=Nephila pilipes TaxID=299642 RepID=A0A8X6IQH7_NEPPI|nr:uncharacterized protein NPIL_467851 [Nephila pilipes]